MSNVRIHNKLPQAISLSLKGEDGHLYEVNLPANGQSDAVPETAMSLQVLNLARSGHVKIRPV